jgi:hypothetical protein
LLRRHVGHQGQHKIDENKDLDCSNHPNTARPSANKPVGVLYVAPDHEEICKHDCSGDSTGFVHCSCLESKEDASERVVVNFNSKKYHSNNKTTLKKKSKEHLLHAIL